MLAASVLQTLQDHGFSPARRLLLAFSGGADSLALLHALRAAGWPVLAAHLDHGLRPSSAEQARQAGQLAAGLGAEIVSQRQDVAAYASQHKLSLEEAARAVRYAFLFEAAGAAGLPAVLTAHQADDQAETLLMHLLRGAGPAGLGGMPALWLPNPWSADTPLVRPLLGVSRAEVEDYLQAHGLTPLVDESNADRRFFRNRLRHDLLPQLEALTPGATGRLAQAADLLAAEQAVLAEASALAWRRCLRTRGPGYLCLARVALAAQPLALQRRLLRQAWQQLGAPGELGFGHVQAALALAHGPTRAGRLDWPGGLQLWLEDDGLWLSLAEAEPPLAWPQAGPTPQALAVPGTLRLPGAWRLQAEWQPGPPPAWGADGLQAWLDAAALPGPLTLRRPQPGDRFQPLGMQGSQKLSDIFINAKLPARARAGWPLVCSGADIVWAAGFAPAQAARVQASTQRVLHLQLLRTD